MRNQAPIRTKKNVVISILGTTLDTGNTVKRWYRWRPNISLACQTQIIIDKLEILYTAKYRPILDTVLQDIPRINPHIQVNTHTNQIENPWDFEEMYSCLHEFAKNYPFNPDEEEYYIHMTTGTHVAQICLFLLTEARILPGKLLQTSPVRTAASSNLADSVESTGSEENTKNGAVYTRKGRIELVEPDLQDAEIRKKIAGEIQVIDLDLSKYDQLAARFAEEKQRRTSALKAGIETKNRQFNHMIDLIERIALGSNAPILLTGPTGAGKTHLARRIYDLRKNNHLVKNAFVEVNCATLRGDQAMSTLFGHVKGAFTGASEARMGLLRAADQGMLFLDEIGELGLDEQAMLLKAIESGVFYPVGADREVRSSFQLVAGTNRDLVESVQKGKFREDLLARINLWTFRLPGLVERQEDIEPNLEYELEAFTRKNGRSVRFSTEAKQHYLRLASHPQALWRGNFRDLNASVVRLATLSGNDRITTTLVDEEFQRLSLIWHGKEQMIVDLNINSSKSIHIEPILSTDIPEKLHTDSSYTHTEEPKLETNTSVAAATSISLPTTFPNTPLLDTILSLEEKTSIDLFDLAQLEYVVAVCRTQSSLSAAGRFLFAASRQKRTSNNDADRLRKYLTRFSLSWERIQPT